MKHIPLTQGQVAIVDDEDYKRISALKWRACWSSHTKSFYAARDNAMIAGKRGHKVYMHRVILGLEYGDKRKGDHINHDTLDNRRVENLRIATPGENQHNRGRQNRNTSGFKGIYWHKIANKWASHIGLDGRTKHLGLFDTPEAAANAYDFAAIALHGDFAVLNFPINGRNADGA